MVVVMNRIPVKPEYQEAFEERFRNRAGLVDGAPGFIRNLVLRPREPEDGPYVIMTFWASQDDFTAWTRSDAFVKAHQRGAPPNREMFAGSNVFEMGEVIQDTGDGETHS